MIEIGLRESDDCKTFPPRSTMCEWFILPAVFKALEADTSFAIGEISAAESLFNNFPFGRC